MSTTRIKHIAWAHFRAKRYAEAFCTLEDISSEEFISFLFSDSNSKWLIGAPGAAFWKHLPGSGHFNAVLASGKAFHLLHFYFTRNHVASTSLILRLCDEFPDVLLQAIRVNRVFFNEHHYPSLKILAEHSNTRLNHHALFFEMLRLEEASLWRPIEAREQIIREYSPLQVFMHTAIWVEEQRAALWSQDRSGQTHPETLHHLTEVLNYFLSWYLYLIKDMKVTITEKDEIDEWTRTVDLFQGNRSNTVVSVVCNVLDHFNKWCFFEAGSMATYCFDMNTDVFIEQETIELKPISMEKMRQWRKDGEKYNWWKEYYRNKAEDEVNEAIIQGELTIKGITDLDKSLNYIGTLNMVRSMIVMKDYFIGSSKRYTASVLAVMRTLNGFINNAHSRFVVPVDTMNQYAPSRWLEHIIANIEAHLPIGIHALPVRYSSFQEFRQTVKNNIPDEILQEEEASGKADDREDLESVTVELQMENLANSTCEAILLDAKAAYHNGKRFNRFRPVCNLMGKPFIRFGDGLLSFNAIVGESDSIISVLENMLALKDLDRNKAEKKETEAFEEHIGECFRSKGVKNVLTSRQYKKEEHGLEGDLDIVAYENGVLVLIELKRSKLRISLEAAWEEMQNSLLKASQQLEKSKEQLKKGFEKYKAELGIKEKNFNELEFYPLIVSTSFENDHVLICGRYRKISWFELKMILDQWDFEKMRSLKLNPLNEMKRFIEADMMWQELDKRIPVPVPEDCKCVFPMK